jgi:hypothetical protein
MTGNHFCTVLKSYIKDSKNNVICIFTKFVMLTKTVGGMSLKNNLFIIPPNNYYSLITT